jgi:cytochrome P450
VHLRSYADVRRATLDTTGAEFTQDSSYWRPAGVRAHLSWYFVWATGARQADGSPGRHELLRGLIEPWFRVRAVRTMLPVIAELADDLLNDIVTAGTGEVDLATGFAYPLALRTVCRLTGVPLEREAWLRGHLDAAGRADDVAAQAEREPQELEDYLRELIAERASSPGGESLPVDLIVAAWRAGTITELECLAYLYGLLHAGTETTAPHIATMVGLFAEFGLLDEARANLSDRRWLSRAGEEVLRFCTPFPAGPLSTVTDVELADGSTVAAGSPVRAWFSAANRDRALTEGEATAAAPDVFDPHRDPNRHLAFGAGMHHCLGVQLARLEASVAVAAVLRALPGLQLDPAREFVRHAGLNDVVSCAPFRFDQRQAKRLLAERGGP